MKKKVFLSMGVFILLITPIIATISCEGKSKINLNNNKEQDITIEELKKSGGIFGNKAKENDFKLIKRFIYSTTNEKGSIFKLIKLALKKFKLEEKEVKEKEVKEKEVKEILEKLKKINKIKLLEIFKLFYEKGFKETEKSKIELFKDLIQNFVVDSSKSSKIESYINIAKDLIDSGSFKEFMKKERDFVSIIKRFMAKPILNTFGSIDKKIQEGFKGDSDYSNLNYMNKIFDIVKNSFEPFFPTGTDDDKNVRKALGFSGTLGSLFDIVKKEIFNEDSSWKQKKLKYIKDNKEEIKTNSIEKYKKLLNKYLDDIIKNVEEIKKTDFVLAFKKGFLNSDKLEFKKNIIFIQYLLQNFLLHFGTSNNETGKWKSNIDKIFDDMMLLWKGSKVLSADKNLKINSIRDEIEKIVFEPIYWKIASIDLKKYSDVFFKLINDEINNFTDNEVNNVLDFLFSLDILDKKPNFKYFNNKEISVLMKMFLEGFNKGVDSKDDLKKAANKIFNLFFNIPDYYQNLIIDLFFGK